VERQCCQDRLPCKSGGGRGHRSPTPGGTIHVIRIVKVNDITIDAAAAAAAAADAAIVAESCLRISSQSSSTALNTFHHSDSTNSGNCYILRPILVTPTRQQQLKTFLQRMNMIFMSIYGSTCEKRYSYTSAAKSKPTTL